MRDGIERMGPDDCQSGGIPPIWWREPCVRINKGCVSFNGHARRRFGLEPGVELQVELNWNAGLIAFYRFDAGSCQGLMVQVHSSSAGDSPTSAVIIAKNKWLRDRLVGYDGIIWPIDGDASVFCGTVPAGPTQQPIAEPIGRITGAVMRRGG